MQGYCVRCKTRVELASPESFQLANGTWVMKGVCPRCNGVVFGATGGGIASSQEDVVPQVTTSQRYYYTGELKSLPVFLVDLLAYLVVALLVLWGLSWLFGSILFLLVGGIISTLIAILLVCLRWSWR